MQYIELRNNLKQKPIVECFMGKSRTTRFVLALLMFASLGAVAGADSQQQSPSSSSPQTWNQLCTQNPSNPSAPSWNKVLQQSNPSPGNTHWNQLITASTYPDHMCPYTPGCQTIQGACATIAGTYGVPAGYTIGSIVLHDCGGTITTNQGGCSPPPPVPVQHQAHGQATITYQPPVQTQTQTPPPCDTHIYSVDGPGYSDIYSFSPQSIAVSTTQAMFGKYICGSSGGHWYSAGRSGIWYCLTGYGRGCASALDAYTSTACVGGWPPYLPCQTVYHGYVWMFNTTQQTLYTAIRTGAGTWMGTETFTLTQP